MFWLIASLVWTLAGSVEAEPAAASLVINEIEINPAGFDTDKEWVELLNVGAKVIDLMGWGISYGYPTPGIAWIATSVELKPGDRYVFGYEGLRLRNATPTVVQLLDPSGAVVDRTGAFIDTKNDDKTWQRFPDGGDPLFPDLWLFVQGTRGEPNT